MVRYDYFLGLPFRVLVASGDYIKRAGKHSCLEDVCADSKRTSNETCDR